MSDIVKPLIRPAENTLGLWAMALRVDSPCFCCGHPLAAGETGMTRPGPASGVLRCARCGAEVSCGSEDFAGGRRVHREAQEHALVAA